MIVTIHRTYLTSGTLGLVTIDGEAFCMSLELPWRDNQREVSCIPTGQYVCRPHESVKHGSVYEVEGVPGRSDILIHAGNTVADTQGCILLGREVAPPMRVRRSREALEGFRNALCGAESFVLGVV